MDSHDGGDGDDGVYNYDPAMSNSSKRLKLSGAANRKRKDDEKRKFAAQGCHRLHNFFSRTTATATCK